MAVIYFESYEYEERILFDLSGAYWQNKSHGYQGKES